VSGSKREREREGREREEAKEGVCGNTRNGSERRDDGREQPAANCFPTESVDFPVRAASPEGERESGGDSPRRRQLFFFLPCFFRTLHRQTKIKVTTWPTTTRAGNTLSGGPAGIGPGAEWRLTTDTTDWGGLGGVGGGGG